MRVSILRTNPYVKNFYEKMQEMERTVRLVLDVLGEWVVFQKNWIYLENIFCMEEFQRQLMKETQRFFAIDTFYRSVSKSFEQSPQVYKGC